jgi:hypothetical protein
VTHACRGDLSSEGLVGPQGVVGAAEQAEFDSEGVAIADDRAAEVLVSQGAEDRSTTPLVCGLRDEAAGRCL